MTIQDFNLAFLWKRHQKTLHCFRLYTNLYHHPSVHPTTVTNWAVGALALFFRSSMVSLSSAGSSQSNFPAVQPSREIGWSHGSCKVTRAPPNHPFYVRSFHSKPSSYWGFSIFYETLKLYIWSYLFLLSITWYNMFSRHSAAWHPPLVFCACCDKDSHAKLIQLTHTHRERERMHLGCCQPRINKRRLIRGCHQIVRWVITQNSYPTIQMVTSTVNIFKLNSPEAQRKINQGLTWLVAAVLLFMARWPGPTVRCQKAKKVRHDFF